MHELTYIPLTLHPRGVDEASQILLQDALVYQHYLAMKETAEVTGPISGVSAVKPLVTFNVMQGRKGEVLFLFSALDTTRERDA
jgi:hypothetical protein